MSLSSAIRATKISESLDNYAISDKDSDNNPVGDFALDHVKEEVYGDDIFWNKIFKKPDQYIDQVLEFPFGAVLSEWVPRVPGLYHRKGSKALRKIRQEDIEYKNAQWTHLRPLGKSRKVIGGIGSLKFPADKDGYRMVSLTMSNNTSSGIPALISPEVWDHFKLETGVRFDKIKGIWRTMPSSWSQKFASTRGIPKACLLLNDPDAIKLKNEITPVRFHPFTVMKYELDGAEYYDFVFANIDSHNPGSRNQVMEFLKEYKNSNNRYGEYLIEPDMSNPIIGQDDIICQSPNELREKKVGAESYLDLTMHRIHDITFNGSTLDEIKRVMDNHLNSKTVQRYSKNIGLNPNSWYLEQLPLATNNAILIDKCMDRKVVDRLVDEILEEYPDIFNV